MENLDNILNEVTEEIINSTEDLSEFLSVWENNDSIHALDALPESMVKTRTLIEFIDEAEASIFSSICDKVEN